MEYIDLGLPSGTLWSKTIVSSRWYRKEQIPKDVIIPTQEQFSELQANCIRIYDSVRNTVLIQSEINRKFITIPLVGWKQDPIDSVIGKNSNCYVWLNGSNLYDFIFFGTLDYGAEYINVHYEFCDNLRLSVLGVSKSPLFPTIF